MRTAWFDAVTYAGAQGRPDMTASSVDVGRLHRVVQRRALDSCPHVDTLLMTTAGGVPALVNVSDRVAFCRNCVPAVLVVLDDGECDDCGRPADDFWPHLASLGSITVLAHVCDTCHEEWQA